MSTTDIQKVVQVWTEQYNDLAGKDFIGYVQIFENKGAVMGCSAPHPHGQIWATEEVPTEPAKEIASFARYKGKHNGRCLLCDYVESELAGSKSRVVCENDSFVVLVPFWAVWLVCSGDIYFRMTWTLTKRSGLPSKGHMRR